MQFTLSPSDNISAVGASNTFTAPNASGVNNFGLSASDYYIAKIAEKYGTSYINYGVSGHSSGQILDQVKRLIIEEATSIPKLVTVSAGANDVNARARVKIRNSFNRVTVENTGSVTASHRLSKFTVGSYAHIIGDTTSNLLKIIAIDNSRQDTHNEITITFDKVHALNVNDNIEIATSHNILIMSMLLAEAGVEQILIKERRVNNFVITDPSQQFRNETFDVATGVFTPKSSAQYVRDLQCEGIRLAQEAGYPVTKVSMVENFKRNITDGTDTLGSGKFFTDISNFNGHFNKAGQQDVGNAICWTIDNVINENFSNTDTSTPENQNTVCTESIRLDLGLPEDIAARVELFVNGVKKN